MKKVCGRSYVHISAISQFKVEEQIEINKVLKLLPSRPDVVSIANKGIYPISFSWVDDWDKNPEPFITASASVDVHGVVTKRLYNSTNPQIYHGKEMMVNPGYRGFNRTIAADRREAYLKHAPNPILMGRKEWWLNWCSEHGVP